MRLTAIHIAGAAAILLPVAAFSQATLPPDANATGVAVTVLDPAGAKVPRAEILIFVADNTDGVPLKRATTDRGGQVMLSLPAGNYQVQVSAPGFINKQQSVKVAAKTVVQATVKLSIETTNEVVTVTGDDGADSGSVSNGEALVLRGSSLRALSDDPTTLQQQLNAMVGSDDGSPPQLRIDGFSGGRMPPKSSIREIRINQNAFSAQFDQRGNSVVDIFTKPGTDKLHGFLYGQGNADAMNATNPFLRGTPQPGYHTYQLFGNVNGPLNKNTSFFAGIERVDQENNAIINAVTPDVNATPFSQAVPNPSISQSYNLRIDHQFGANNTFTGRFDFSNQHQVNTGVGQLVLQSQGYTSDTKASTLQLGNTTIFGPHVVMESRFQYLRTRTSQTPVSSAPTLTVQGSFNGGGSSSQTFRDAQDNFEWQEYLSVDKGKHFFRGGLRYRLTRDSNSSTAGYNGSYTFASLTAYRTTLQGIAAGQTSAQIRAAGGGPSQYFVTAGTPSAIISTGDLGLYFEDEWKIRPAFSLTSGLRYESQYGIPDHNDPAPRVGFSWQISRKKGQVPVVHLRGGVGLFYDRFSAANILIAARQNGILQRSYYLQNPDFYPTAPAPSQLSTVQPTIYQIAPNLHSSYIISEGISAERRVLKYGNLSLNYTNERGVHQFLSRNANAPLNGVRPLGGTQNIYQYASEGTSNTRTFSSNFNMQFGNKGGLWSFYALRFRQTDAMGANSFVSNSYNVSADYGRTGFLTRHRFFLGGWTQLPFNFSLSSFLSAHSTTRFNITTGQDNNGDSIFNDRPAFATDLTRASVVRTAYGDFDTNPIAGQTIIPINYGKAPNFFSLETQFGRSFSFGPNQPDDPNVPKPKLKPGAKPAPPDRLYHLNIGVRAENVLNRVNAATPVGQLSSPYFGRSLTLNNDQTGSTAANRVLSVYAVFNF